MKLSHLLRLLLLPIIFLVIFSCESGDKYDYGVDLNRAIVDGDIQKVKKLLDNGADVNVRFAGEDSLTPLFVAVFEEKPEIAALLLSRGADANMKYQNGGTPLMTACARGNKEIVKLLLDNGADATAKRSDNGDTAMDIAMRNAGTDIIELLKGAGENK